MLRRYYLDTILRIIGSHIPSQRRWQGVILLTGIGIVPPDGFTLAAGDVVQIGISGVGTRKNPVAVV